MENYLGLSKTGQRKKRIKLNPEPFFTIPRSKSRRKKADGEHKAPQVGKNHKTEFFKDYGSH